MKQYHWSKNELDKDDLVNPILFRLPNGELVTIFYVIQKNDFISLKKLHPRYYAKAGESLATLLNIMFGDNKGTRFVVSITGKDGKFISFKDRKKGG